MATIKEISVGEKAKRYDEAKLRMSAAYNSNRCTIGFVNEIFPELAESEDERIRKELIDYFKENNAVLAFRGISNECVIAWLEKQGEKGTIGNEKEIPFSEQKPAWSEEDEKMLKDTIRFCELCGNQVSANWLKSLRPQNVCSYNPYKAVVESIAEMCEKYEDANLDSLKDFYSNVKVKCKDAKEYDSLYPKSQWKPSDEQIKAIRLARSFVTDDFDEHPTLSEILIELEAKLKKLKEA